MNRYLLSLVRPLLFDYIIHRTSGIFVDLLLTRERIAPIQTQFLSMLSFWALVDLCLLR